MGCHETRRARKRPLQHGGAGIAVVRLGKQRQGTDFQRFVLEICKDSGTSHGACRFPEIVPRQRLTRTTAPPQHSCAPGSVSRAMASVREAKNQPIILHTYNISAGYATASKNNKLPAWLVIVLL